MVKRVYSSVFHPESKISAAYRRRERVYNLSIAQCQYEVILSNLRRCFDCEDHFMVAQLVGVSLSSLLRILDGKFSPRGVVLVSIIMVLMDLGYDKGLFGSEV